jgi:hypothetical protein
MARAFLPDGHDLEAATACGEKGKNFPVLRSDADDIIIRFKLSEWNVWGQGTKSCDCLFLCKKNNTPQFVIVLVELKGYDTRSAFDQIASTAGLLCKASSFKAAGHCKAGLKSADVGHGGRVVAFIVAPGGGKAAGMWQVEAAKLKRKKILMQSVHKPGNVIKVDDLYHLAFDEKS